LTAPAAGRRCKGGRNIAVILHSCIAYNDYIGMRQTFLNSRRTAYNGRLFYCLKYSGEPGRLVRLVRLAAWPPGSLEAWTRRRERISILVKLHKIDPKIGRKMTRSQYLKAGIFAPKSYINRRLKVT
jgi:hypothetical protein